MAGPLPIPLPRDYSGLMQLETATRGPIVLGCVVPMMPERPMPGAAVPELLELVAQGPATPRVKRARLGCPSEARLLASPKMQRLLSACRYFQLYTRNIFFITPRNVKSIFFCTRT